MSRGRPSPIPLEERLERLELLQRISLALSAERDRDRLIELILVEAKTLCGADGGTLYLRTEQDTLRFAMLRSDSLGMALGGTTGKQVDLPEIPLFDAESKEPLTKHVASYCAVHKRTINVRSGVYRKFGERYLPPELLDAVNEDALLAIRPKQFVLPPEPERLRRKRGFVAPYDD